MPAVIGTVGGDGRGRLFWRDVAAGRPIVASGGIAALPVTLDDAAELGYDDVLVLTDLPLSTPDRFVADIAGDDWRVADWQRSRIGRFSLVRLVTAD